VRNAGCNDEIFIVIHGGLETVVVGVIRRNDCFLNAGDVPDFLDVMCVVVNCIVESDVALAISLKEGFTNAIHGNRIIEFFERLEVLFVAGHTVSTARIINPNVIILR
jgi:hypothetical protein